MKIAAVAESTIPSTRHLTILSFLSIQYTLYIHIKNISIWMNSLLKDKIKME